MSKSAIKLNFSSISGSNIGNGIGIFSNVSPSNTLNFRTITAGNNISLNETNGVISISSFGGGTGSTGGSVAGNNTEVQFNDNGEFGASSGLTYNGARLDIYGDFAISGASFLRAGSSAGTANMVV